MGTIDNWTVEADGIRYRIDLEPDYDSSPGDADCYSPSDRAAFERGDWSYVGVIVTPEVSGTDYTDRYPSAQASLWGVEYGTMPAETEPYEGGQHEAIELDRDALNRYPVPELISEARAELRDLRARLASLPLDDCDATHPEHPGIANGACRLAYGHTARGAVHSSDLGEWGKVCEHPDYEGCAECDAGYAPAPDDCDICQTTGGCRCNQDNR